MNDGLSLEKAVDNVLCGIREVLDAGLDDMCLDDNE